LNALAREEFTMALSVPLFLEYEEVLKRPESLTGLGLTTADVDAILMWLAHVAEPVERIYFLWRTLLPDEDDGMVLECAVASDSDALVTLNMRHFETVRGLFGLDIILPREFLQTLRGG
jgi:predicted nucleic acid-binding protein